MFMLTVHNSFRFSLKTRESAIIFVRDDGGVDGGSRSLQLREGLAVAKRHK